MSSLRTLRRVRVHAALPIAVFAVAAGALPAGASAALTVDMASRGTAPAVAAQVNVVGDGADDHVVVQRRLYDDGGDGAGPLGDPSGYSTSQIVEFTAGLGETIGHDISNEPALSFCTDFPLESPARTICGINTGVVSVNTAGTDLGAGSDEIQVLASNGTAELDLTADGGPGNDFVTGGPGNDALTGGAGLDTIFGNGGDDAIKARDTEVDSRIQCGGGTDTVEADHDDIPDADCETVDAPANPVTLQFAFASTTRGEGDGFQILPVNEATPSTGSGTFKIEVIGGTATKGSDYAAAFDGQLVDYDSGAISFQVSMGILEDTVHEADETVIFKLTSPTGDVVIGAPDTFTVTITDNDPAAPGNGGNGGGGGAGGGTETPDPLAGKPIVANTPPPVAALPRPGLVSKRLPDFTRGGTFLAAACKTRGYCDVNDVRTFLLSEGLTPEITIKTTSSINDAPDPKKVVLGEVVGSTPRDGDPVSFVPGDRFPMELQVFGPKVPESEQKCKASQKIRVGADTTLGKYLVGKTLEEVKKELLTFECFSKKGPDESNVKYAITTSIKPGTRYAEVDKVSDQRIDGSSQTTLVVAMRVPPSELVLSVGPDPEKPGLGLALSDGTLTVDPDTKVGLKVRVGAPGGGAPVPAGTEVTLRDPDGQLVDRAITDASGEATITGLIPEAKRYEFYASVADKDGDAIAGSVQLEAKKRSGSFATLSGVKVSSGSGGAKAKPLAIGLARRAQGALVPCTNTIPRSKDADIAAVQAAAEGFFCAYVRQSNRRDLDAPLARYAARFPSPTFNKIEAAADKFGPLMTGDLAGAAKEGMTVSFISSGNPTGKFSVKTPAKEKVVATVATDGQKAFSIPASVTQISDGLPSFRDSVNDVTFAIDGRVIFEGAASVVTPSRQIADAGALSVSAANFSIFPGDVGLGAGGIVAGGAGNIIAAGAGNIVAGGAGNIVAGGAGNIVAGGAGNLIVTGDLNIVAGGAGNIVAGGAGNIVAGGAGNIVAGGAGNIIAGGAGNIVAGGAGNLTAGKLGQAFGAVANRQGQIVASGGGN